MAFRLEAAAANSRLKYRCRPFRAQTKSFQLESGDRIHYTLA